MTDTHQAVYDAVRSRITGCNVGEIVREFLAANVDFTYPRQLMTEMIASVADAMQRPSVLYRPALTQTMIANTPSGWSASYGGLIGLGESPEKAMEDFDKKWKAG